MRINHDIKQKSLYLMFCLILMLSGCGMYNMQTNGYDGKLSGGTADAYGKDTTQPTNPANLSKENSREPYPISLMAIAYTNNPATGENPIVKRLEEYTGTKLELLWANNSSYEDELNLALSSGTLPDITLFMSKSPAFISAAESGMFWEIGSYLSGYDNLRQADTTVLRNISINGKIYGLPRMRILGRYGIIYREDWLRNAGLKEPGTIDEFYAMLKAFTENDPDGNGKNDTYGLIMTSSGISFDIMQTWFGAPKEWNENSDGTLTPAHMTTEYRKALKYFRRLYAEKLMNQDFPIFDASRWNDPFVNGEGGCIVDVLDRANTLVSRLERAGVKNPVIDIAGSVNGPEGLRNLSTSGYNGLFAVSKSGVRNEDELARVLEFMDKLNDREMQDLLYYGIEGRHYVVENGMAVRRMAKGVSESERNDLSMLLMFIPRDLTTPTAASELREKITRIQEENRKIIVYNPAEPITSDIYAEKGSILDRIISEARIRYITGEIDDAGLENAMQLWLKSGGADYIKEVNKKYAEVRRYK